MTTKFRNKTRRQRQEEKTPTWLPLSVATINFDDDANLCFTIRACASFGVKDIHVIGNTSLNRQQMNAMTGTTQNLVSLHFYSQPSDLLSKLREQNIELVSFELVSSLEFEGAQFIEQKWLPEYRMPFWFKNKSCLFFGHKSLGIPPEIILNSKDVVGIPMNGPSFCINVAMSVNIALYEASNQYQDYLKWQKQVGKRITYGKLFDGRSKEEQKKWFDLINL